MKSKTNRLNEKRAIEKGFPFEQLNRVAELESWRKEINRPMYHIHKWWAQRLGSVFRAIVLSSLSGDWKKVWERFYKGYDGRGSIILDPFMGSGTTLGEALKLNSKVVGCDINPVAYFLVQKALEEVSIQDLKNAYARLELKVKNSILHYYRTIHEESREKADILYTFWVMQAPCPTCGGLVSLFNNYIFSANAYPGRRPEAKALCPKCDEVIYTKYNTDMIKCPECGYRYNPREGTARRNKFYCNQCHEWHSIQNRIQATRKPPNYKQYALMLWLESGRKVYTKVSQREIDLYNQAGENLSEKDLPIPNDPIPPGHNTDQARGYNFFHWKDLFNQRQLNSLAILFRGIIEEKDRNLREFMLILFSSCLEFNSMFCSFKGEGTGAVRHMFYHHILKPERTPLENSVWGFSKSSGTFSTLFRSRLVKAKENQLNPFEIYPVCLKNGKYKTEKIFSQKPITTSFASSFKQLQSGESNVFLLSKDSSNLPIPDKVIDAVITDPPYFDFVHYSELADYFYVWLKLGLKDYHRAFQNDNSRHEAEVQNIDKDIFRANLARVYTECNRVLKDNGLLVFTYHHSKLEGWEAIYDAVKEAGFSVVAAYPLKAEMSVAAPKNQAREPINLDSIIVCKKTKKRKGRQRRHIQREIYEKSQQYVKRFNSTGTFLSKGDLKVIVFGEYLVALSDYIGDDIILVRLKDELNNISEELYNVQEITAPCFMEENFQQKLFH